MTHIFLCCNENNPKCCTKEASLESYEYLKKRLFELGLSKENNIRKSKANCLQVCKNGPIAVVYPEGMWYELVDKPMIDKIIEKHCLK